MPMGNRKILFRECCQSLLTFASGWMSAYISNRRQWKRPNWVGRVGHSTTWVVSVIPAAAAMAPLSSVIAAWTKLIEGTMERMSAAVVMLNRSGNE